MPTFEHARLRRIEGRHNALVKELRTAFAHAELTSDGHCAVEGGRLVEEAIRSGARFKAVFFTSSAEDQARKLLPQLSPHIETVLLPDRLFARVVPSDSPQGVAALVRWREFSVEDVLANAGRGPLLALAGIQDPGNLGTILRSAEAFGAAGALVGEGTVSPFNPKVVRASAGSVFRLPVVKVRLADVLGPMRERSIRRLATSSHKGTPLDQARLAPPIAIFIGREGSGLPRDLLSAIDEVVAIPHSPDVESLNAGVAASIVLYEFRRQWPG